MSSPSFLLQNGIIFQHDSQENVNILYGTDLLVVGNRIEQIGRHLSGPEGCRVIDCSGKIVSPGFVDTHHHVWQTQLKGRHSDDTLLTYMPKGNLTAFSYTAQDVFWGEVSGCLEAIDAGTTCVVDHAHMTYSPDHVLAGLSGAITSGIRSVFCYSIIPRLKRWDTELEPEVELIPAWSIDQLKDIAGKQPFGDGRITIGLGFDLLFLPKDQVVGLYQAARDAGVKTITTHFVKNNALGSHGDSAAETLHKYSLLGPDILLSHATGGSDSDFALLKSAGASISATPATESQMAHGEVVCFRSDVNGSLGVDCHTANSTSMLHAMHVGLAVARSHRNQRVLDAGNFPRRIEPSTSSAFNLATIGGAKAIGREKEIGSLQVGKKADLVVFATDTPAMACAVEQDPLAAVVRHAGTREVEMVVIDGVVRKASGRLVDVNLEREIGGWDGRETVERASRGDGALDWADVMKQLRRSREEIQQRIDKCDMEKATTMILQQWGAGDELFA